MKQFLKICALIGGTLMLVLLHHVVVDILPYPFELVNLTYTALLWWLMYNPNTYLNTLIVTTAFLSELYATTPFGVVLISMTLGLIATNWMLTNVFTNHSWYMVFLVGGLSIAFYRIVYVVGAITVASFMHTGSIPNIKIIFDIFQEILLSSILLEIAYIISRLFSKKMNPRYISLS